MFSYFISLRGLSMYLYGVRLCRTEYITESCLAPTISIRGSRSPKAVKPLTFGSVYTSLSRKAFAVMAEVRV